MIEAAVQESCGLCNQLVSMQVIRFSPDHPEGIRMTQESAQYSLGGGWLSQGVQLYARHTAVSSMSTWLIAEFGEQLHQHAPGWLASTVSLRIDNWHLRRRPISWYARRPCGIPSGFAMWVDPIDDGVTYLLTIESLTPEAK
jgi:hypothetical protein